MVKKFFDPVYKNVENWTLLDTKTFNFYSEEETPFEAVCVEIGTLTILYPTAFGNTIEKTPIIRWITKVEYEALKRNSGVVIF